MARAKELRSQNTVFINCPFDNEYRPMFRATLFVVIDCGFLPRCALEESNGASVRIDKIMKIISESRLGIHDLSRTELDAVNQLPRFNMPFELGLFLGARRFGNAYQKSKECIILDKEMHRFQKFISDISGQDVVQHKNEVEEIVVQIRNWLNLHRSSGRKNLPGGESINARYKDFGGALPLLCKSLKLVDDTLTFKDYVTVVQVWLDDHPSTPTTAARP